MNQGRVKHLMLVVNFWKIDVAPRLLREYIRYHYRKLQTSSSVCKSSQDNAKDTDSFANGSSAAYIEGLYTKWSKNPRSVDSSWDAYFSGKPRSISTTPPLYKKSQVSADLSASKKTNDAAAAAPAPASTGGAALPGTAPPGTAPPAATGGPAADWKYIDDHLTVQAIIRAYQVRGHLAADLDPLGIVGPPGITSVDGKKRHAAQAVLRQHYDYVFNDLNATFKLPSSTMIGGDQQFLPLKEILDRLERVYCGHIGVEYMQITSLTKTNWIRERFEKPGAIMFAPDEKKLILERLTRSTGFENFLAKKFTSEKRFGLEGCDIMIPIMKEIIDRSTKLGVESIFIGMAHRGRLNVLANICRKPIADILSQFHGLKATDSGSGDVKYHLGLFTERLNRLTNKNVRITVVANPSHLEYVNPVVLGKARAEMYQRGDSNGSKVLSIIIHGDASFCGQGVVYESIHLSDLPCYTTFGTIHIVANNQVGFTTDPRFSRSSRYCTDVARVVNAPIFHVNADDPEACIHCARVSTDYRAEFHKDVVIDIVGYRRNGHNEADEPMFTQPLMYQRIRKLKPVTQNYAEKLIKEGVIQEKDYKDMIAKYEKICDDAFIESKKVTTIKYSSWIDSPWTGFFEGRDRLKVCPTGVSLETLNNIGEIFSNPPPAEHKFEVHKGVLRILALRKQMVKSQIADWSLGEAFAIGSLLKDGIHVRLSGQDVERGTFSHRHHVFHHQSQDKGRYNSIEHLYPDQSPYVVCNSSLSECAIMGFEHGYSMAHPNTLVIWEAQFGDFANTAQTIIDSFIASGETKWVRQSGLVLLLPHSMEGMGPEHSSGRIERFLQLSDDDPDIYPDTCDCDFVARQLMDTNWIVTNLSTPANLFHALRRQVALGFRKPLINFSPKSVLRHPLARSPFRDFTECSEFMRIIPENGKAACKPDCVQKVIFCSGKVYYDLVKEREEHEQDDTVAIIRVEQICPFPYDLITKQIELYKNAELIWCQEEHKNQGSWSYVQQRFDTTLIKMEDETRCISYHGRPPNSAPSTGNKVRHYTEYKAFMTSIFGELTEENKQRLERIVKEQQLEAKKASSSTKAKTVSQGEDKTKAKASKDDKKDDKGKPGATTVSQGEDKTKASKDDKGKPEATKAPPTPPPSSPPKQDNKSTTTSAPKGDVNPADKNKGKIDAKQENSKKGPAGGSNDNNENLKKPTK